MTIDVDILIHDLVDANRILSHKGILDGFGHVSARAASDRFFLSRSVAPGLVERSDIIEFDLESEPITRNTSKLYLERFIHGEIYRRRPDVGAIVHSHAPSLIPFGVVADAELKPIYHMAGFIGQGAPVFEIRDVAGDTTDLLIRTRALGKALAQRLTDRNLILMRGHGATVVGDNIRQATYRAVYAELNAALLLSAKILGAPTLLSRGEAAATMASIEPQLERSWSLWKNEIGDS